MQLFILVWALFTGLGFAQFQFFEQMFQPPPGHGHAGHQHRDEGPRNVPSDSEQYQRSYNEGESCLRENSTQVWCNV